jgi:hypothetical protein
LQKKFSPQVVSLETTIDGLIHFTEFEENPSFSQSNVRNPPVAQFYRCTLVP